MSERVTTRKTSLIAADRAGRPRRDLPYVV